MFIELESERSSKLRRCGIFSFFSEHIALLRSWKDLLADTSYKHLAALRPGQIQLRFPVNI
jgi:hypothetical protein